MSVGVAVWLTSCAATEAKHIAPSGASGTTPLFVTTTTGETQSTLPLDPTGEVYALDLANGEWLQPMGIADLFAEQAHDLQILMNPTAVGIDTIEALFALAPGGIQDRCTPTVASLPSDWADPDFTLALSLFPLEVSGFEMSLDTVTLSGAFVADGSSIEEVVFEGFVDTRTQTATYSPCAAGLDGCLAMSIEDVPAQALPGVVLETRTAQDIDSDPLCE